MKNFIIRTLTAVVYVALLVGCTLGGPISAFLFYSIVAMASLWEFCTLMNRHYGASLATHMVVPTGLLLPAAMWLWTAHGQNVEQAIGLYGLMLLYLVVRELYRKAEDPLKNLALIFASQIYVNLPFALLPLLCVVGGDATTHAVYSAQLPMALFVFIWINDTGAYLCGSMLHKVFPAKLFPRISPKKSWVGSIGGGLLTLAAGAACYYMMPEHTQLWQWLGFALVVVVFGTWGDLVESLLKRYLGIKDSGHILPGHGGMLDRFDSSLLAIPAVVLYFLFV